MSPSLSRRTVAQRLFNMAFPFWDTVRTYTPKDAKADFLAGITVAIVASPQSMAYAIIAGVDPVYGLYASMLPVIVAALWGSSRYLLAGPTNAISMILYSTMSQLTIAGVAVITMPEEAKLAYLFGISVLAGLIQFGMGVARLGDLANFISHAVILAFTTGASILIALGQLRNFFGLEFVAPISNWELAKETLVHLPQTHMWSLAVGLFTLLVAVGVRKFRPHWPNALLALVASGLLCVGFDLAASGMSMAGAVPQGLPPLSLPTADVLANVNALFLPAMAIALLGSVESLAIARTMASQRGDKLDGSQELIGQGLANVAAGLTSGITGCGSFSRSAVNFTAGARTRFAAAFSGLLTLSALLALGPLVQYIPIPALAALLLLICANMINIADIKFTTNATKSDLVVFVVTLACVLILDLEKAVFVGVILSLMIFLHKQSHPTVEPMTLAMIPEWEEQWLISCPYVAAYRVEGPLFFGAVNELENLLYAYENFQHKVIILQMNRVSLLDATGAHALRGFLKRCAARESKVIICWSHPGVRETIVRTGLSSGPAGCYLTGSMNAAALLTTTLLREANMCASCCSCEHGKDSLHVAEDDVCLLRADGPAFATLPEDQLDQARSGS